MGMTQQNVNPDKMISTEAPGAEVDTTIELVTFYHINLVSSNVYSVIPTIRACHKSRNKYCLIK